jgi:rubredoxin
MVDARSAVRGARLARREAVRLIGLFGLARLFAPREAGAAKNQVWVCTFRDCIPYYYDPARGDPDNIAGHAPIPPGTPFEALPEDWICPNCGSPKNTFRKAKAVGDPQRVD